MQNAQINHNQKQNGVEIKFNGKPETAKRHSLKSKKETEKHLNNLQKTYKNIMKTTINIWNPNSGNQIVTLKELREMLCDRRMNALKPSVKKEFQREVTVHTTDKTLQQVAAHYTSFQLRQMNIEKALEVFNAGGSQVATIVKEEVQNDRKMSHLKKELGITNKEISELFELSELSYLNSSAKKRYENALCKFYELIKKKQKD